MSSSTSGEIIKYNGSMGSVDAYLVRPKGDEPRPAILVIHEIFGLVDHTKDVANRLASQGYVVLAPHLFSSNPELASLLTPSNVGEAFRFMQSLPTERMRDPNFILEEAAKQPKERAELLGRLSRVLFAGGLPREKITEEAVKGVEWLNSQSFVKTGKVGTVGFCFGGGQSINVACHTKTAACIIFYGDNPSPIELLEKVQCPVLGIYGGEDQRINSNLDKLVSAMARYKKDFEMKIYPGAPHAFFNDTSKATYREAASRDAWNRSLRFFEYSFSLS